MSLAELEYSRYIRNYQKVKESAQKLLQSDISVTTRDYLKYLEYECDFLNVLKDKKIEEKQIGVLFKELDNFAKNQTSLIQIDVICLKLFLCQFELKFEKNDTEDDLLKGLHNLSNIKSLSRGEVFESIEQTPFRAKAFLEVYLKRILKPDYHIESKQYLEEINDWLEFFAKIQSVHQKKFYSQFKVFEKVDKNLILIGINKLIQIQNKMNEVSNIDIVIRMLQFFQKEYRNLYGIDLVITLLYNICKNILPLQGSTQLQKEALSMIIEHEHNKGLFQYFQLNLKINSWDQFLLACLGFIQVLIDKKVEKYMNSKLNEQPQKDIVNISRLTNIRNVSGLPNEIFDSLYLFTCINFTQIRNKIKKIMRGILSFHVPSLINIVSLKIKREDLAFNFMEFMMNTPFDDNILGMKMSVQLYVREEYSKLYQLIQSLTQSEQLPSHPLFSMLLSLASIFTGLNLGKNEEGLSLAKLNLNNFLGKKEILTKKIIQQETLLAHIGFSYYNIFRNAQYEQDKSVYLSKAIEYLEKSYERNKKNYLVCQALAKAYANSLNLDKALEYALQSCSLNKSSQYAFILLALIYSAKGELKKCQLLISHLLKENQNEPILYILMAFIETEKLLHAEENLPDYKVSHHFGSGVKDFLKSTLSYFIDILFHLEYYESIDDMANLLNDGNKKNFIESEYYKALLSEHRGQSEKAIFNYEEILKSDFYHLKSMQNLALLYLKDPTSDSRRIDRSVELLIAGSKFQESSEICYGFGQVHQLQGNLQKSNHYLLKALEKNKKQPICSYDIIPDLLFYL